MTSAPNSAGRRKEPRYQGINPETLTVTIERKEGNPGTLSAELMDLSRGGLRLSVRRSLPKDEEIQLTIIVKDFDVQIHAGAKVCWASPGAKDGWYLGCTFLEKITEESIDELASHSAIERRRDPRQAVSFSAEANTELGAAFETVHVVNFSAGGFCALATTSVATVGERLMVRLPTEDAANPNLIRAKVAWVNTLEDGQSIGCTFFTRDDYLRMQSMVNPDSRRRWLAAIKKNRPTRWQIVAAVVMLIMAVQLFYTSQTRPDLVQRFHEQVIQRFEPWIQGIRDTFFST